MTSLAPLPPRVEEPDGPVVHGPPRSGRVLAPIAASRRAWTVHALLLAIALGVVFLVVGHHQVASADEGASLLQAKIVERTGQWSMPTSSELDPTGEWYAVYNSNLVGDRAYPFSRPPIYPATIRPLLELGGLGLVIGLHVLGLWLAACGAGALCERLRPGRGIQAMWLTGALSPLLFDGYWVIAHSIAAAGAAWAVVGALRVVLDRRWAWLPVWATGLTVATLYRNESLLFAAALAVGLMSLAGANRTARALSLSVASAGIAAVAWKAMNVYQRSVEGNSRTDLYHPAMNGGLVAGRLKGVRHALLTPGEGGRIGVILVALVAILLGAALVSVRFDVHRRLAPRLAVAAAAAAVVRLFFPIDMVTGLVMTAPLIVVAALLLPRAVLREPAVRAVAITTALTGLAVAASMHEWGGGSEWGGRYFHVVLPLACVLAVLTMHWMLEHRGAVARTVVMCGLVVSLALSVLSIRESRGIRDVAEILTETAWRTAARTQSAQDPEGPVVVGTWNTAGRFSWRHLLDGRYLTVAEPDEFPRLGRRLAAAGVPDFTILAEPGDQEHLGDVGSGYQVTRSIPLGENGWTVAVLSRQP